MKRKISALLSATLLAASLAACGSNATQETTAPETTTVTASSAETQESTAPESETESEAEVPELSGTMKVVATSEDYVTLFDKFTEETGVEVELLSMSSGDVLSKLRAEGGYSFR